MWNSLCGVERRRVNTERCETPPIGVRLLLECFTIHCEKRAYQNFDTPTMLC